MQLFLKLVKAENVKAFDTKEKSNVVNTEDLAKNLDMAYLEDIKFDDEGNLVNSKTTIPRAIVKAFKIKNKVLLIDGKEVTKKCIAPMEYVYDNTVRYRGFRPIYYVAMDDLLPQLKDYKVVKLDDTGKTYSWTEILKKELFKFKEVIK